ncbi:MAG: hypothetical protein H7249_19710 [Chitinophagaceae bacterium]|nr:hypothetical protein [Oligoflexus sp.]
MKNWKVLFGVGMPTAIIFAGFVVSAQAEAADRCKAWSWSKGERVKAQFGLASQLCVNAIRPESDVVSSVKAVAGATGYLLNVGIPLLTSQATLSSPQADSVDASGSLLILGQKVWSPSISQKMPFYEKSFSVPALDKELPYSVALGPVTVNLQAGIRGEAGIDIKATAGLAQLTASLRPHFDTSAYALVQADVVIVKAGIQGDLTFAKGEGKLEGSTQLVSRDTGVFLTGGVKATYDINLLRGSVKVFADPFEVALGDANTAHAWEAVLYAYDGFTYRGTAFEYNIPNVLVSN